LRNGIAYAMAPAVRSEGFCEPHDHVVLGKPGVGPSFDFGTIIPD
jgi:hypothetical protein